MRLFALLLTALLTACGPSIGSVGVPTTSYTTKFSIECHPYDTTCTSPAGLADVANNLHAKMIRTDYDPPSVLNGSNGYDYSWVPQATADGLQMYFITPYVDPTVIASGGFTSAYITEYAQVAAAGAARFPGSVWDIVNEPNNDTALSQGQMTVAQYIQLLQTVIPAMKAADPTAVFAADVSGADTAWLTGLRPVYSLLAILMIHPYGTAPNQLFNVAKAMENATGMNVGIGEWGESPQSPADLTAAVSNVVGQVSIFNLYEYDNQPGETTNYGILGTPAYSAYAGAILGK